MKKKAKSTASSKRTTATPELRGKKKDETITVASKPAPKGKAASPAKALKAATKSR